MSALKGYLPLNDYSARYHISLSTLRRRIRSGDIEYRFEGGKYWLADRPPKKYGRVIVEESVDSNFAPEVCAKAEHAIENEDLPTQPAEVSEDPAKKMVQELKGAYVKILHEKESQITELKEEISDLKTLVKILEADNERLRLNAREAAPIDAWLESEDLIELSLDDK